MMRRLYKGIIIAVVLLLTYLTAFRLIPRLLPWSGQRALEELTWSPVVQDRSGQILQVRPVDESGMRRLFMPYGALPDELIDIILTSEDSRFRFHPGVDPVSAVQAALRYRQTGIPVGGGSTVSMQLVRIISPRTPGIPVTFGLKIREAWQALQIESRLTKKEILELYINLVPFGRNIQGHPAASWLYYGKELSELSFEEYCVLTVIPRSPRRFDPLTQPEANLEAAQRLAHRVKKGMSIQAGHQGLLSNTFRWPFEAPHFVEALQHTELSGDELKGLVPIVTTLDINRQREARKLLNQHVESARSFRISNGALIMVEPVSMEIIAYVGSADFFNEENSGQVDGVRILREPGSTLKPLLYAEALESGWTASTILPDVPMDFGGQNIYTPRNYNEEYHGPVRLRQALAASLNIPAVYTLEHLGVLNFVDILVESGMESLDGQRDKLGTSLAIGGGEVSLAELVQSYGALYSGGFSRRLRYTPGPPIKGQPIWSPTTAAIITDIISTVDDRVMTFGRTGPVRFDYPAAVKTGTSNQFTNIWAVGFTSDLLAAVWMGNFDGSTVIGAPGSSLPALVLHDIFDEWSSQGDLPLQTHLETYRICSLSGALATPYCPYQIDEIYAPGTAPQSCDWHTDEWGNPRDEVRYPQEYSYWAERYNYNLTFAESALPRILYPAEGAVFYYDSSVPRESQVVILRLAGSGHGRLRVNGEILYEGPLPTVVPWMLRLGSVRLVLENQGKTSVRRIEIR